MKWVLRIVLGIVLVLGLGYGVLYVRFSLPRPEGTPGPAADELARRIQAAAKVDAWAETGAVSWTFRGKNQHLWDRARNFDRVRWDDREVLIDLASRRGVARRGAELVTDEREKAKLLDHAWAAWINDSFWLNPIAKLFDDGVVRSVVDRPAGKEGATGLLVTYTSGGLTPGDSYLWIVRKGEPLPSSVRMWVSNLPLPGFEVTWDGWQTLESGTAVATRHSMSFGPSVDMGEVRGARTLAELAPATDPFEPLRIELRTNGAR